VANGPRYTRRVYEQTGGTEVGALESVNTQYPDVRRLRPLGNEGLERDQARGSCETTLLTRARPSRALRVKRPSGRRGHDGNRDRATSHGVACQRCASSCVGPPSPTARSGRGPLTERTDAPPSPAHDELPKSPARRAMVSSVSGSARTRRRRGEDEEDASMHRVLPG
jgi:hypothetical protein